METITHAEMHALIHLNSQPMGFASLSPSTSAAMEAKGWVEHCGFAGALDCYRITDAGRALAADTDALVVAVNANPRR